MGKPDDSGQQKLHQTINELDPASTLGNSNASVVALTREKAEALIGAIQQLGKSNLRLANEFKNVKMFIVIGLTLIAVLIVLIGISLWRQAMLLDYLEQNARSQAATTKHLDEVIVKLEDAAEDAEDIEEKLDAAPKVTIQPADSADPTSKPVAVLEVPQPPRAKKGGGKHPKSKVVQIPLDLAPRKKK